MIFLSHLARRQIAADENGQNWDGGDVLQHGIGCHSDLTNPRATGIPGPIPSMNRWFYDYIYITYMCIYPSIYLSIYLSIDLSIDLSIHPSIYPSIYLSI